MSDPQPVEVDDQGRELPAKVISFPGTTTEMPGDVPLSGLPPLVRATRPLQWIKNLVVFTPLIFSDQVFELSTFALALGAFASFCLASSAIYLFNDIRDIEQDRIHPEKRHRPLAAGQVKRETAMGMSASLAVGSLVLAMLVRPEFAVVILAYLILMGLYNLGLKMIVFLDVFAIAAGFLLRAGGGAVAIDVPISPWLYLCTLLLALLLGFGKRRHELVMIDQTEFATRASLEDYSVAVLDQVIAVVAGATLIAYGIYTIVGTEIVRNNLLTLTIPIVAYALFRYLYLVYQKEQGGSPEVMLVQDRPLMLSVVLWGITCIAILTFAT